LILTALLLKRACYLFLDGPGNHRFGFGGMVPTFGWYPGVNLIKLIPKKMVFPAIAEFGYIKYYLPQTGKESNLGKNPTI
jgi:hypothetical protein